MAFSENIGKAIVEIIGDPTKLQESLKEVQGSLEKTGRTLTSVGKTLSVGITAPLVAMGAGALAVSTSFETAFTGVAKTVDASQAQLAQLESEFRKLATTIPVSTETLFGLGQAAGQLGIRTENIVDFATTMAMMAEATDLSADRASTALARMANITQLPQEQISNLGSAIVALGNTVAATESEIVEMSLRISAAGSQIGLSQAQITGFAAALAAVGIQAEAGGTAISTVMLRMRESVIAGGEELASFAQVAGMSAQQFATAFQSNPQQAIVAFVQGLQRMTEAGEPTQAMLQQLGLGGIRTGDALRRLGGAGDLLTQTMETATTAFAQNTALQDEFAQRVDTSAARSQILTNQFREAAATLGDALQPAYHQVLAVASQFAGILTTLAQVFANLNPGVQQAIIVIAALAAAIGPALIIAGQFAGAIVGISKGITLALPVISALVSGFGSVITIAGQVVGAILALNPIILAIGAAVALFAAAWIRDWGGIRTFTLQTLESLRTAISSAWAAISSQSAAAWNGIGAMLNNAWQTIRSQAISAFQSMASGINAVWGSIVSAAAAARDSILGIINSIASGVRSVINAIGRIREAGANVVSSVRSAIPGLQSGGTITRPGLALVGEAGPELLRLPRGAQVTPLTGQGQGLGERIQLVQYITAQATPQDLQRYTERALRRVATEFGLGVS